ncbi:MAG: DNA mismatch repair protein MutS, partial [Clostridia bacterium]|nr:DNA mismatch repair protein MutS [Clostridia bacterium]
DINTRRNLELCETMRQKEKRGSLLWVLDRTKTAMGARQLRSWVLRPLINPVQINKRQSAVAELLKNRRVRDELREILLGILDIERLTAKTVYGTANAKDLRSIYTSTQSLPIIKELALSLKSPTLTELTEKFDTLDDLRALLGDAITENPPLTVREGGMIKEGFNADVDFYRSTKDNAEEIMRSIEERERDLTGIRTLRISSNSVFGYYIEVSKSFMESVPDRYIRKQTLANCERYITQELKEMESAIFGADEKLKQLEYDLFCELRGVVAKNGDRIRSAARVVAELDTYASLAEAAEVGDYTCPEVSVSDDIYIKDGRHPVVEKFIKGSYFVPNDTVLDTADNKVMIITGPNMAGKSTYMRQVALITIMAQIGSFVPARDARIGIVDKIFTRVGASDDLASGQSTFMLEMSEVAYILKNATRKSLIIYDEVGRGTSTFDGMSIARSVVEYTASKKIGAKTLFATHYHELTDMEGVTPGIVNYNIVAKKRGDDVIFLRKIVRGGTDDSYGIEVAKLAGVPAEVIRRSKEILADIEKGAHRDLPKGAASYAEPDLFTEILSSKNSEIIERLQGVDINTITPIEAMNLLFELKKML